MPLFTRKPENPLTAQQKKLEAELARLQSQLGRLASGKPPPGGPRGLTEPGKMAFAPPLAPAPAPAGEAAAHGHYNDLGVRKWDFAAAWQKLMNHVQGPTGNNPQLTKMLAAGSIHGLRPLRREKRVARNRFIALFLTLFLILVGVAHVYLRNSR